MYVIISYRLEYSCEEKKKTTCNVLYYKWPVCRPDVNVNHSVSEVNRVVNKLLFNYFYACFRMYIKSFFVFFRQHIFFTLHIYKLTGTLLTRFPVTRAHVYISSIFNIIYCFRSVRYVTRRI